MSAYNTVIIRRPGLEVTLSEIEDDEGCGQYVHEFVTAIRDALLGLGFSPSTVNELIP